MSYTSDNMTCQYVFANNVTSPAGVTIDVPLPGGLERTPNVALSLMECKLVSADETPFVVKMREFPSNYFSADNMGCALGVTDVTYRNAAGNVFHTGLNHNTNPAYNIASNTRKLTLFLETLNGTSDTFVAKTYSFIFKLEYPDQPPAGIVNQYVGEIHRGL
tara:strand:+ start:497 stop:982 length:486 start_codon:yes stop_codon:yes gene_type:complete